MKHKLMPTCVVTVMAMSFAACNKDSRLQPTASTSQTKGHQLVAKGKGFNRKGVINEKNGLIDCVDPGTTCKATKSASSAQAAEIALLQTIISTNGNGNAYFNTPNWQLLFGDISDEQTWLINIAGNQLFLYQITSAPGSQSTYGYSYVLSSAQSLSLVSAGNSLVFWQY